MKVYVASSWRNDTQPIAIQYLRLRGFEVYDFRNPSEGDKGFHWSEIDPEWKSWDATKYINSLNHPIAQAGYAKDWEAMQWAEACLLIMPCGRSAHLEAGYFVGARKPLIIMVEDGEPELMYKMATSIVVCLEAAVDELLTAERKKEKGQAGTSTEVDSSCLTVSASCREAQRPQADASPNTSQSKICPDCFGTGREYNGAFGMTKNICWECNGTGQTSDVR